MQGEKILTNSVKYFLHWIYIYVEFIFSLKSNSMKLNIYNACPSRISNDLYGS